MEPTARTGFLPPRNLARNISPAFCAVSVGLVSISSARQNDRFWPLMRFHVSVARHSRVVLPFSVWIMYSGWGDTRKSCSILYSSRKSSKLLIHTSRSKILVGSKTAPTVPGLSMQSKTALAHNALVFPLPKPPMKPRMRCFSSLQNSFWAGSNPSTILNRNFSLVSFARLDT